MSDENIPVAIAVQMLQTIKQVAEDVAKLRSDVLPCTERLRLTLEAQAAAEAAADASLRTAQKALAAADAEARAEAITTKTKRESRVDRILVAATNVENVKKIIGMLVPFLFGMGGAGGVAAWWTQQQQPMSIHPPVRVESSMPTPSTPEAMP